MRSNNKTDIRKIHFHLWIPWKIKNKIWVKLGQWLQMKQIASLDFTLKLWLNPRKRLKDRKPKVLIRKDLQ